MSRSEPRIRRWFGLLVLIMASGTAAAADSAAIVLALNGDVHALRDGEQRALQRRSPVFSGDTVVTGDGEVQLRFTDGTLLSLYAGTRFAIDDYRYGEPERRDRARFSLLKGVMHTLSGEMDKSGYRVRTRLADLSLRGTDYTARLDQALDVEVRDGAVLLNNPAGGLLVGAGQGARVTSAGAMPMLTAKKIGANRGPGGGRGRHGGPPPPRSDRMTGTRPGMPTRGGLSDTGAPPMPPSNTTLPDRLGPPPGGGGAPPPGP